MRVYLTGATGLIGSHVAEQLRQRGDAVVALVRPTGDPGFPESIGAETVTGDLLDEPPELAGGMAGCDAVIHAAAKVFERGRPSEFRRLNLEGTEHVLRAARLAEVGRVVHVSSIAVYGDSPGVRIVEDDWVPGGVDRAVGYASSKDAAEGVAWRHHEEGSIRLTTVRPAVVYGERDRAVIPLLDRYTALPVVPILAGGGATVPIVYAGNVARGVIAALDRNASIGRAYNLGEDVPVTTRELLEGFARAMGRRMRTVTVPAAPFRLVAPVVDLLTRTLPVVSGTRVERAVRLLSRDNPYDSGRARRELDWTELTDHEEALARAARWYRRSGAP